MMGRGHLAMTLKHETVKWLFNKPGCGRRGTARWSWETGETMRQIFEYVN